MDRRPPMTSYEDARVGVIGWGSISRELSRLLVAQRGHGPVAVLLPEGSLSRSLAPEGAVIAGTMAGLLDQRPDVVVEAAGHRAAAEHLPAALAAGVPAILASIGVLADDAARTNLLDAARRGGTTLTVPAGAIGGLDYLQAAANDPSSRVDYVSRKPPASFRSELEALGLDPDALAGEVTLFAGAAAEAARRFPRNLNVALAIGVAVGLERVSVRVVADPAVRFNTHEIEVAGDLGAASMRFANAPSPANPKTSVLTAYSLLASVRRLFSTLVL
jgi:aspartate dehydrogenase